MYGYIKITAQKSFMLGGWVPYWKAEGAVACVKLHCDVLDQISPFCLEVDASGKIRNTMRRKARLWQELHNFCKKNGKQKLFVPTIYWTNTDEMHTVLSNKVKREAHIQSIIDLVLTNKFDGININYERVCSHDREDYLLFLQKLSHELHRRGLVLYTSIGGRTGDNTIGVLHPNHKHKKIEPTEKKQEGVRHAHPKKHPLKHPKKCHVSLNPGKGEEAARYKRILVQCCDQIHIMGYDEWGRPYKRSKEHLKNKYYVSHSSHEWIEQIIEYALTFVPREKLVLGIPTYGLEFAIFQHKNDITFKKRRNVTVPKAHELAAMYRKKPTRTAGGELSFTYTNPAREERYVCFVDDESVKDKIKLAKKYGIKGIYLFTINGEVDKNIWPVFKKELASAH